MLVEEIHDRNGKDEDEPFEPRRATWHITILLVGEQSTRAGHTLADVGEGTQVGLLGLVAMLPQQRVHDLLLQVGFQLTALDVAVDDGLCGRESLRRAARREESTKLLRSTHQRPVVARWPPGPA